VASPEQPEDITTRFSKHYRLIRTIAYCLRFAVNCKVKKEESRVSPLAAEVNRALLKCVQLAQRSGFGQELHDLANTQEMSSKSILKSLMPFLDSNVLLRVGGHIQKSSLSFDAKHQMILPTQNNFKKLLIEADHIRLLNAAPPLLISTLRQKFGFRA
jgi:hypothetical protein